MSEKELEALYIDGIGNINLTAGSIRCDLVSVVPQAGGEKAGETRQFKRQASLVMTPQGLYQSATVLNNFVKQLEESGILKKTEMPKEETGKKKK